MEAHETMESNSELESITGQKEFYEHAAKYWEKIPATVDGMLGGFGFISHNDILGSKRFLKLLFQMPDTIPERKRALDCGAGIGRITGNLLTKFFDKVDLVEQNKKFVEQAMVYLKSSMNKVGHFYPVGLQNFCPEPQKYDLIWCQWVLGHLNNTDLIQFFQNCRQGLTNKGVMVVKENVTSTNKIEIDKEDSSMTRPRTDLIKAFEKSGFKCIKEERQHNMPEGLYPIYMFALKPCDNTD